MIAKPNSGETPPYFQKYIDLVSETELLEALKNNLENSHNFFASVPKEKENSRYAEGKWSVKEVIGHIIDTERVFAYRAMRFSRKDVTELAGYDENFYAPNSNAANRAMIDLINEYKAVRDSNICLFSSLTDEMLDFKGRANKTTVSARSIGWMITGHAIHHCNVIRERYLSQK